MALGLTSAGHRKTGVDKGNIHILYVTKLSNLDLKKTVIIYYNMLFLSDRGIIRTGGDRKRQGLERAIYYIIMAKYVHISIQPSPSTAPSSPLQPVSNPFNSPASKNPLQSPSSILKLQHRPQPPSVFQRPDPFHPFKPTVTKALQLTSPNKALFSSHVAL